MLLRKFAGRLVDLPLTPSLARRGSKHKTGRARQVFLRRQLQRMGEALDDFCVAVVSAAKEDETWSLRARQGQQPRVVEIRGDNDATLIARPLEMPGSGARESPMVDA